MDQTHKTVMKSEYVPESNRNVELSINDMMTDFADDEQLCGIYTEEFSESDADDSAEEQSLNDAFNDSLSDEDLEVSTDDDLNHVLLVTTDIVSLISLYTSVQSSIKLANKYAS